MSVLAIIDTETTGIDPAVHRVIEIGCVLWDVARATILATWSDLVQSESNEAEAINRIPASLLTHGLTREQAFTRLRAFTGRADILVAHRAEFDAAFLPDLGKPWVCSKFDIDWPMSRPGDHLVNVAIAHGVAVTSAHRALTDCLLIARTFEAVAAAGHNVAQIIDRAMRPRGTFEALTSYDEREATKAAGFVWDPKARTWTRRMAIEDAERLPFKVRRLDAAEQPQMETSA